MTVATVVGHMALLVVGRAVLVTVSGRGPAPLFPVVTSAIGIATTAPLALRLFASRSARAWWLVAPAVVVLAVGALAATWSTAADQTSPASAALTAFGAALSLSSAGALLGVRAALHARVFSAGRAMLPLLVGFGVLALVAALSFGRAPAALLALPPALVGLTALAIASGSGERRQPTLAALADGVLISAMALGAVALASFATGAVTSRASTPVPAPDRLYAWAYSLPVVLATWSVYVPRVQPLGLAVKRIRLDVLGTVGLLVIGLAITHNQLQRAQGLAQMRVLARAAAAAAPVLTREVPARAAPSPTAAPPPPALAARTWTPAAEHVAVRLGPATVDGPLLPGDAVAGVGKTLPRFQSCYERLGNAERYSADLQFIVDAGGSVANVELAQSNVPEPLQKCLSLELYRTGFATPAGARASVTMPLEFGTPR